MEQNITQRTIEIIKKYNFVWIIIWFIVQNIIVKTGGGFNVRK